MTPYAWPIPEGNKPHPLSGHGPYYQYPGEVGVAFTVIFFIATAVFEKLVAWTLEANSVLDRPPVKVTRYTVDAHFGIWHTGTPPSFPPWAPLSEL